MKKFDVLILTGRPASGKSEVIDYIKHLSPEERLERLGIGEIEEIDDFPFVWECFEIDDALEKIGSERVFTQSNYYFKDPARMWRFFIERINREYEKRLQADPHFFDRKTLLVEFARGGERGLSDAFSQLNPEILKRAGVLYIHVSHAESVRRNKVRARPGAEGSILYHSLPDDKMDAYYRISDWSELAEGRAGYLIAQGRRVPYSVFENESDVTSDSTRLGEELHEALESMPPQLMDRSV